MIDFLVRIRNGIFGKISSKILLLFGVDIPSSVRIGKGFVLAHRGNGVVIHPNTVIGDRVKIYQQVTIGRSNIWCEIDRDSGFSIVVCDDVIIGAGAKILTKRKIVIGKGTTIGANSVLTCSTGENEVWAGVPARLIKKY